MGLGVDLLGLTQNWAINKDKVTDSIWGYSIAKKK